MLGVPAHPEIVILVFLVLISILDHCTLVIHKLVVDGHVYAGRDALFKVHDARSTRADHLMCHSLEEEWHTADSCQTVVITIDIGTHAIVVSEQAIEIAIDAVVVFHRSLEVVAEAGDAVCFFVDADQAGKMEGHHICRAEYSCDYCYINYMHQQEQWTGFG